MHTIFIHTQSGLKLSPVIGSSAQSIRYSVDLSPIIALILYTGLEGLLWLPCMDPTVSSWDFQRSDKNLALLDRIFSVPGSALFLRFRVLIMQLTWLTAGIYCRHLGDLYISKRCFNCSQNSCVQVYTLTSRFMILEKRSGSKCDTSTNRVRAWYKTH